MEPKILVVDDNAKNLATIKENLALNGLSQVKTASSFAEAREIARDEHFDAIVTDMIMEAEDAGYLLARHYREYSPLIIVLTAFPNDDSMKKSMRAGAYDYISKNDTDAYEQLVRAIKEGVPQVRDKNRIVDRDAAFMRDKFDELAEKYEGQYIAVLDERVVGADQEYEALKKKMREAYPYSRVSIMSMPTREYEIG